MRIYTVTFTVREDGLEREHCVGLATRPKADLFAAEVKGEGAWGITVSEQEGDLNQCAKWPVLQ